MGRLGEIINSVKPQPIDNKLNGLKLVKYYQSKYAQKFPSMPPPPIAYGRDGKAMKTVLSWCEKNGGGEIVKSMIDYMFDNWKDFRGAYNIPDPLPTVTLFMYCRDKLFSYVVGTSRTHRFQKSESAKFGKHSWDEDNDKSDGL